jgi:hypothetical protein
MKGGENHMPGTKTRTGWGKKAQHKAWKKGQYKTRAKKAKVGKKKVAKKAPRKTIGITPTASLSR